MYIHYRGTKEYTRETPVADSSDSGEKVIHPSASSGVPLMKENIHTNSGAYPSAPGVLGSSPGASYIPADIAAISSFNASLAASNNLFKQNLEMIKQSLAHSRMRADAIAATCNSGYRYTSLEGAKEYIRATKGRSLTEEEARRMVEMEM
jgi:hypothetical protein